LFVVEYLFGVIVILAAQKEVLYKLQNEAKRMKISSRRTRNFH